jgi:cell division protein ZapA (FtsZ GTPase activity inhibitor)
MAAARVELTLLGQTLTVRTEAPADYMRSLATYVEERVRSLHASGVRDPVAALTLAAVDIVDELFRAREDHARVEHELESRLGALVDILDGVTGRDR